MTAYSVQINAGFWRISIRQRKVHVRNIKIVYCALKDNVFLLKLSKGFKVKIHFSKFQKGSRNICYINIYRNNNKKIQKKNQGEWESSVVVSTQFYIFIPKNTFEFSLEPSSAIQFQNINPFISKKKNHYQINRFNVVIPRHRRNIYRKIYCIN